MTAEEIRKYPVGYESSTAEMLREIAAQLAELNQAISDTNYLRVQVEPGQYPIRIDKP